MRVRLDEDGSSPLARGTLGVDGGKHPRSRFIPAGAGNTSELLPLTCAIPVHPRWRGEHERDRSGKTGHGGSSPLARGTRRLELEERKADRFIPAGAGNTPSRPKVDFVVSVHPRWRGEHCCTTTQWSPAAGSSPLARGTQTLGHLYENPVRFIPTGAGNTCVQTASRAPAGVHPRWRGEHDEGQADCGSPGGSSPLARGTHGGFDPRPRAFRFIPAGAGNTGCWRSSPRCSSVHPRWRGEHIQPWPLIVPCIGSSPLARGTLNLAFQRRFAHRFIPAGAGNTYSRLRTLVYCAVHPRWRGEHFLTRPPRPDAAGSSPLARGTPLSLARPGWVLRFIPAGAGNTMSQPRIRSGTPVHPRWRGEHILGLI